MAASMLVRAVQNTRQTWSNCTRYASLENAQWTLCLPAVSTILPCRTMTTRRRDRLPLPQRLYVPDRTRTDEDRQAEELTPQNMAHIQESYKEEEESLTQARLCPLKDEPWPRHAWTPESRRTGVLATKIGMMPMWTKTGHRLTVTLLQVQDCHVIRYIPVEDSDDPDKKQGMLTLGHRSCSPFYLSEEYLRMFEKAGIPPKRKIAEFKVSMDAAIKPGTPLYAAHFRPGQYVDVYGKTIDKGFQGVMKRHGFKGQPASHGQTKTHRRPGAIGTAGHGRVLPGTKLPGPMGNVVRYTRGLKIWRVNTKHNILYVNGQVPGHNDGWVKVYDSILYKSKHRKRLEDHLGSLPFPTYFEEEEGELEEDLYDDELFRFDDPSIVFETAEGKKK
ncbi:39S ribosomal protein L3, mitochondrial-like [Branchiostoma floridae]|uniref:Large ribosomal subunit protein uL3m n=1 Tax=Branchiostoma floridae TaxID=7739 RepID=A0A9J7LE61_BRAFL|nr:39S ribosomal protein L3, mitochondrial-like [Branchiostoma floridae]